MSDVLERPAIVQAGIVDCDIHPTMKSKSELYPWLAERWRKHLEEYGAQPRVPFTTGTQYPKAAPATADQRADVLSEPLRGVGDPGAIDPGTIDPGAIDPRAVRPRNLDVPL